MSIQRTSQLLETIDNGIVKAVLTQLSTFPYTSTVNLKSISICNNDTSNVMTFIVTTIAGIEITNYVPPSCTYDGNYDYFKTITTSGSNSFVMELRGEK